ncbi:MAG: Crp/Fnr family transcriptional regulator [Pseudomonadota bacterium]
MKTVSISSGLKTRLFSQAAILKGLSQDALNEMTQLTVARQYQKNEIIFQANEPTAIFILVFEGLIRVSRYSATGKRLTYLLAGPGEPIDLVRPFTGDRRENIAEAVKESTIVCINREEFLQFAVRHPQLVINIIGTLGQAVDSSNSRILDMLDKKVIERLKRVLHSLYKKFGPVLNFTAVEIAELAGTTTESSLRVLGTLCQDGIIEKSRGQIHILRAEMLPEYDDETAMWI